MRITRLELRDVPGIDSRGLVLDGLDAPVVLLLGPNASGKSTARRCIEQVLFQRHRSLTNAHIVALFTLAEPDAEGRAQELRAEQRHGQVVWTRDGAPASPPALPASQHSGCYAIGARELLEAGDPENDFAFEVRKAMVGGLDVVAIRESLAASALGTQFAAGLAKSVKDAKKALRDVEGGLDALADEEDQLGDLRARKEAADAAAARQKGLRTALGELEQAEQLLAPLVRTAQKAEKTADAIADRRDELDAIGPLPTSEDLALADRLASDLQALDATVGRATEALASASAAEEATRGDLQGVDTVGLHKPDRDDLSALQRAWTEGSARRSELAGAIKSLERLPDADDGTPTSRSLDAAIAVLHRWLANGPREVPDRHPALIPMAAILLVLSTAAAIMVSPWFALGTGLALAALVALVLNRPNDDSAKDARDQAVAEYRTLEFAQPVARGADWELVHVERIVRDLRNDRDHAAHVERAQIERSRLTHERDETSAQLAARDAALDALRTKLGLAAGPAAGVAGLDLAVLASRILALDAAERATASAEGLLGAQRAKRAETADRAMKALGLDPATRLDPGVVRAKVAALQVRAEKLDDLAEDHVRGTEDRRDAVEARDVQRGARAAAAAALDAGPDAALEAIQAHFAPELAALEEQLKGRDGLLCAIQEIETRLQSARERSEWEESLAARSAAEEDLAEAFATRVDALCAKTLLDDVENEYERSSRPEMLERAATLFADFTHGRYNLVTLQGEDGEASFAADDAETGGQRTLDELSDGTRMQLLLALRIAFAEYHERGESLPIILDEVFSMSDRARVFAMVDAVGELALGGRQVLYLGADEAIENEWNAIAREVGHPAPAVCRIGDAARAARSVAHPTELLPASGPDIPDPGGSTPEDYGHAVGAGLLDPYDDASSLHLLHLFREDLPTLAKLLRQRITTLGLWEALVERGGGEVAIGSASLAEGLSARAAAARALVEAWHVSRGHPVTRTELEESGSVSDTFLDRLCEYLDDVGGSAVALFEELDKTGTKRDERVKGFRAKGHALLRDHLIATEALDLRAPLTPEVQDERARAAAPDLDPVEATRLAAALRGQLERELSPSVSGPSSERAG